jgi:hypothetical protein
MDVVVVAVTAMVLAVGKTKTHIDKSASVQIPL